MKTVISMLALSLFIVSCSKSKENLQAPAPAPAQPSAVGFFKGSYDLSSPFAILFRADGTMRIYANSADTAVATKAEGTYEVAADKTGFDGTYTYLATTSSYYIWAAYTQNMTKITGQYLKTGGTTPGNFTLTKQ